MLSLRSGVSRQKGKATNDLLLILEWPKEVSKQRFFYSLKKVIFIFKSSSPQKNAINPNLFPYFLR